jgi:hypothetical protein
MESHTESSILTEDWGTVPYAEAWDRQHRLRRGLSTSTG